MISRSEGDAGAVPVGPAGAVPGAANADEGGAGDAPVGPGVAPGAAHAEQAQVQLTPGGKPSGLRNPTKAMRGLGSGALFLEAIVLLLAIQPARVLGGDHPTATLVVLLGSAVVAILLTGLLRHNWAWWLGSALQVGLLAGGFFLHWAVGTVGVLFGLVWLYVLYVRRSVLR